MKYNSKQEELINFIENECADWLNLKVLDIKEDNSIIIQDNEGYKYSTTITVIRNAKRRNSVLSRFFRNNPYTIENIKTYLVINNIPYTLQTEEIKNAKEKVVWDCSKHGCFETSWNCIQNGYYCPFCGKERAASKRRNSYNYVKNEFTKRGFELISKTYQNNEIPLNFICLKHKDEGVQQISFGNLISNKKGCICCSKESYSKKMMKTHEKFCEDLYIVHGDKYKAIGTYKGSNKHIKIKCNQCEHIWSTKATHLLSGHGCPKCASYSIGEDLIRKYLINNKIVFQEEYRINKCRYKKPLPFDFAIFDSNELKCLIEFDGKQHFEPFGFGCKSESQIKKNFEQQKKRDKIKDDYCNKNNINFIRIPYWKISDIDNILDKTLNR